ncbi:MAG: sensor histidine kinase, partial [Phyllobacteriaceae bacterium]|nr:sensor histidine kinase [Phyllobacteriaceae bacterium]
DEIRRLFVDDLPRAARAMPEAGGGLGLVIARRVAGAMGGTLDAESPSPAGSGTRVTLRLPIEPGAATTPAEAPTP